jgi:hypothetical protein
MGYLIVISGIIGDREKSKVESKISETFQIEDYSKYFVINLKEIDCLFLFMDIDKITTLRDYFHQLGIIKDFRKLNLDEILDKINYSGLNSLDIYEKKFLDAHKHLL